MRLTIATVGSRGDVQPYLALSCALKKAGYTVRLATHALFAPLIAEYGIDFLPIEGNPREILEGEEGKKWLDTHKNPVLFFAGMMSLLRQSFGVMAEDILKACKDSDAILFGPLAMPAYDIAEKFRLPSMMLTLQPMMPTGAFPSPAISNYRLGSRFNKLTHLMSRQLFWYGFRRPLNDFRKQKLGLRPAPFWGPWKKMLRESFPVLAGFSPSVLPKPDDWNAEIFVTGYWFLDAPTGWEPPADLVQFLAAGEAPVYIGFGSMTDRNPEGLKELVLNAVRQTGQRAVLHSGWAGLNRAGIPDDIFLIDSIPHSWLFPQMRAIVHHCGAGTTAAALRSGVPGICVPYFGDQHFWASIVHSLGVCPAPVPRKNLTADRLASAIRDAIQDPCMRQRASQLGSNIRNEDGLSRAVEIISGYLAND